MSKDADKSINKISVCEVCGNNHLENVLDLGFHAMCDDLIKIGDQNTNEKYPIKILFCNICKTAHQEYQVPKKILFPETYHYRAALTKDVLNGMRELVESCESKIGDLKGKTVLDIGCNDGSLLSIFKEKGAITFGIEPTGAAEDAKKKNHTITQDYFGEDVAIQFVEKYGNPDIITFTNVFAHIEDLGDILVALNILMKDTDAYLVIENHYLGAVIEQNQFDTFYHEHPRTYSYTSFIYIAKTLGANITAFEFPKRYGGNIRVFMTHSDSPNNTVEGEAEILEREALFNMGLNQLSKNMAKWQINKRNQLLDEINNNGKLRAKAFPGRAAIILELLELTEEHIAAVYEQAASPKVGCYIPGTRIPIKSDDDFDTSDLSPVINLAWHIQDEIASYLKKTGFEGSVLPIISQDDFV